MQYKLHGSKTELYQILTIMCSQFLDTSKNCEITRYNIYNF